MSLIDEALKRARHEAARQDAARQEAARREGPTPWVPLYERDRRQRSSRRPLVAGILAGVLVAALGVAGGLLWTRRDAPPAPAGPSSSAPVRSSPRQAAPGPAHGDPAPAEAPPPVMVEEVAPPAPTAAAPPATARPLPQAPPTAAAHPASEPVGATHASPPAPTPRAQPAAEPPAPARPHATTPPRAAEPAPAAGGRSHAREATLPGGRKLALTGIAWSDTQPVALINGKVVGPGEIVEGYTVVGIQPQRVELRGDEGTVFLDLR